MRFEKQKGGPFGSPLLFLRAVFQRAYNGRVQLGGFLSERGGEKKQPVHIVARLRRAVAHGRVSRQARTPPSAAVSLKYSLMSRREGVFKWYYQRIIS